MENWSGKIVVFLPQCKFCLGERAYFTAWKKKKRERELKKRKNGRDVGKCRALQSMCKQNTSVTSGLYI